ncbi:ATP-binding protein [Rubritalea spongiae]|uniref:ATP-binding protein n=1 Tax=Rubritalea spongiae TaxID=430797 RepID=A0ABW5E3Q9_9BACT
MRQFASLPFFLVGLLFTQLLHAKPTQELSLPELEQRIIDIDAELEQLAQYSLRSGIGSIGYRSNPHDSPHTTEWLQISLEKETQIDTIVLTPTIRRDASEGYQADAFPVAFKIIAGTDSDDKGSVIVDYRASKAPPPSIAPLIFEFKDVKASWIKLEATELSQRAFDSKYIFQLSELMVFSGEKNVALRRPVKISSTITFMGTGWNKRYLVDGHTPYLMDAATGQQSVGFISKTFTRSLPSFIIDLGKPTPLSHIHLHAVDQSDTIPQAQPGDYGLTDHLLVTGFNRPDQSDAVTLIDFKKDTIQDTGPIMMWNVPESRCRYVQVASVNPDIESQLGFAEVEVFSKGRNVALKKTVNLDNPSLATMRRSRRIETLTDGQNFFGEILPIRNWLQQLARRHELEVERPLVADALQAHYTRQKENLKKMKIVAAILAAGTIIIILITHVIRQRAVFRTRERIAANLHDELGANLHAIGLFGDLAKQEVKTIETANKDGKWDRLVQYVDEIRTLTEHTGKTARYCANMLEADGTYSDLAKDMRKTVDHLKADLEHDMTIENEELLQKLPPRRRIGIFLFYKECITNIIRHANATRAVTHLTAAPGSICLSVYDNGKGLTSTPVALKRRARLLKGKISIETPEEGGTKVTLKLQT